MRKVPRGPLRSNCLLWAVVRFRRRGGHLIFRRSRHSPLKFHCMWSRTGEVWWGYGPVAPVSGIAALSHGTLFRGRIKRERPI